MLGPAIRLSTLGGVHCTTEAGEPHPVTTQPRRVALLVYLLLAEPRGFHSRDHLLALFWPDHDEARARNALSQAVHFLRRSLSSDTLLSGGDDQLCVDFRQLWCDVFAFEAALAAGRTTEAIELYHGPFLDGFHVSAAAAEFERWVDSERERLARLYAGALQAMAGSCEAAGDYVSAVQWHRRLAAVDPLSSNKAIALIRALASAGDYTGALQHARVHETLLRAELDVPPDQAITALVADIRRQIAKTAPNEEGAIGRPGVGAHKPADIADVPAAVTSVTSSRAVKPRRATRRTMIAACGAVAALLAIVPMASRKRAEVSPRIDCVAVLPMENLSSDSTLDYYARGLTAGAITELGHYEGLEVKPRPVLAFKGSMKPLPEIGRALNCAGIVQGSLTRTGKVVHVDAQIADAPADRVLWSDAFEDDTTNLLVLERRVINTIAQHVRALGSQRPNIPSLRRRVEPRVYTLYVDGRDQFRRWNAASVHQAIALFQQAVDLDSTFAAAYAGLADAYELSAWQGYASSALLDSARTLAARALALDTLSSEAHATEGFILASDGDWTGGQLELQRAIALDSTNALAHYWYAMLLAILNRKEDAFYEIDRASQLDPKSQAIHGARIVLNGFSGRQFPLGNPGDVKGMADPNQPGARAVRAIHLARKGRCAEAYPENRAAQELAPDNTIMLIGLVEVELACHDSARAKKLLAHLERRPDARLMAVYIAMAHVAQHQPDSAFAWLAKSRWGLQTYWTLRTNRDLEPIRSDPRFGDLLRQLHLL